MQQVAEEGSIPEDIEAIELDETSQEFIDQLVMKLILFTEEFCNVTFFPYQIPIAYRMIESIVIGDGEEITLVVWWVSW